MLTPKVKKLVKVQSHLPALLSGMALTYYPAYHRLMALDFLTRADLTVAVVFGQLEYLYVNKISGGAVEEKDYFIKFSLSKLTLNHFPWLQRRQLRYVLKFLNDTGWIDIQNQKKGINHYVITTRLTDLIVSDSGKQLAAEFADPSKFILVFPSLTKVIGLAESVILQRLHYLSREGGFVQMSYANLHRQVFECVSQRTVKRAVAKLIKLGLITAETEESWGSVNVYSLVYDNIQAILSTVKATPPYEVYDGYDPVIPINCNADFPPAEVDEDGWEIDGDKSALAYVKNALGEGQKCSGPVTAMH